MTKKGDDYIWETREKKPLVKTRSGVYTWFLSPTGTGYIKVASREAPGILIEPLTYMEHLTIGFLTITYWGKLEDFQDEPEEYDLAIESYPKAISIDPNDASVYNGLGFIYSGQGNYDLAIEYYQKAISIDSKNGEVYSWLGHVYYKQGKYDLAIESFQKAISIDPESALFHYNLGRVYSLQDKKALSIGFLRKAISFGKNYIDFDGMAEKNSDFDNIRESPEFQALIRSVE